MSDLKWTTKQVQTSILCQRVKIADLPHIAPKWRGKVGQLIRWVGDNWYIVKVDDIDLVLDLSRSEFTQIIGA